jgi:hypothetical protein
MNNPYTELIEKVEENFQTLAHNNATRDSRRERFERKKILLLALILGSAWVIFFLLCDRLDSEFQPSREPSHEYVPPAHYQIHQSDEPIYAI